MLVGNYCLVTIFEMMMSVRKKDARRVALCNGKRPGALPRGLPNRPDPLGPTRGTRDPHKGRGVWGSFLDVFREELFQTKHSKIVMFAKLQFKIACEHHGAFFIMVS